MESQEKSEEDLGEVAGRDSTNSTARTPEAPTASDLFNRQVDIQKIEFLNGRVLHLQAENEALRERHDKREQETHEFVAYFQKEIHTRDKQITKLTEEVAALKLNHALELEASQQARESESQQLQQHFSAKEEKFTEQLFFLKEELNQLESFKEMKETIHKKMKDAEAQLLKERDASKEQVGALERKFLEEKARLQKDHEKKIEIVKQQAKEDARNGLDADTRKIVTDNRRMGEELRFQLQMTEELQKEKEYFEAKAKKYHMELQISKAKEEEYAAAAQKQAREIKQLRATIKSLEKRMSEGLAEMEREKMLVENKSGKELEEMTLDLDGMRRLLRLKNKELRNLRRLSQMVLDQRTEVEVFFLDALELVKREIDREQKQQRDMEMLSYNAQIKKAGGHGASSLVRFPKLTGSSSWTNGKAAVANEGQYSGHFSEKIDIRQLSWEDKERVLRLVFAKINGIQSYADATPSTPPQIPFASPHTPHDRRMPTNQEFIEHSGVLTSATSDASSALTTGREPAGRGPTVRLSMSLNGTHVNPSPPVVSSRQR